MRSGFRLSRRRCRYRRRSHDAEPRPTPRLCIVAGRSLVSRHGLLQFIAHVASKLGKIEIELAGTICGALAEDDSARARAAGIVISGPFIAPPRCDVVIVPDCHGGGAKTRVAEWIARGALVLCHAACAESTPLDAMAGVGDNEPPGVVDGHAEMALTICRVHRDAALRQRWTLEQRERLGRLEARTREAFARVVPLAAPEQMASLQSKTEASQAGAGAGS